MNLRHNISSGVSKSLFLSFIIKVECKYAVLFLWDITEKNEIIMYYRIQEWHTFTTYDILHNQSNYSTACLLLDTAHRDDHYITVCGKWIFGSNFKMALPLTRAWLNYICSGNDSDKIEFIAVLHAIRAVHPEGVQKRLNMK